VAPYRQVASTDGVALAVHDLGGSGPPLLVCHATGFCGLTYGPLAAELGRAFHVWALDFRAHGDSSAPALDRIVWAGMTDDLEAVVDELFRDRPFDVVGHSMGGAAALLLERRRPGTLRSAYLFEPIIVPDGRGRFQADNPMARAAARRRVEFPSKAAALMRYASRTPLGVLRADALAAYVEHGFAEQPDGTARLKLPPAYEAATFSAVDVPTLGMMGEVTTPTTIAVGAQDEEYGPSILGPAVAAALPRGRLERYPTLSHFGPLQDPPTIAAAVLAAATASRVD
jgi:pimeloyl-ACP methyl ester carboxylesterase